MSISNPINWTVSAASTAPTWFTDLTANTWTQVGTGSNKSVSAFSGVADSLAYALTDTWTGGCVDDVAKDFINPLPGGHNPSSAGSNNGVFRFRLGQANPFWDAPRIGEQGAVTDWDSGLYNGTGYFPTFQPSPSHTYHRPIVVGRRVWIAGIDSQDDGFGGGNGRWTTSTFSFDLTQTSNGVWNRHGRWRTSGSVEKMLGGCATYDAVTDRIFTLPQYTQGGFTGAYFNVQAVLDAGDVDYPAGVLGATALAVPSSPGYSWMGCDEARRLVIYVSVENIQSLNPDNPAAGWTWRTGTAPPITPYGGGYCYHKAVSRIYSYPLNGGGNTIRVYDVPASGAWPSTWRTVTLNGSPPSNNAVGGSAVWAEGGPFGRFNIVQNMGNGDACLVYYPRFNVTGMWVASIPAEGL